MAYTVLSNFRFGLDARRSELTSQPGTLQVAENCHVNPGGEVEKRKAFVRTALPVFRNGTTPQSPFGSGFGIEATSTGLVIFGRIADPGGWPANVTYQQLIPPDNSVDMTAVIFSTVYAGKVFVIAEFGSGNRYAFYDGALVTDFYYGKVLYAQTSNVAIASKMAGAINTLSPNFTAAVLAGPNDNKLDVTGVYGEDYSIIKTLQTAHGILNISLQNVATAPRDGVQAAGRFSIVAGSIAAGTNKITSVKVNNVELLGAAVDFAIDLQGTAQAVAAAISSNVSTPDYTAIAEANVVKILALAAAGDGPNSYEVKVVAAGDVCVDSYSVQFLNPSTVPTFTLSGIFIDGTQILTAGFLNGSNNVFPGAYTTLTTFVAAVAADIRSHATYLAASSGNRLYVSRRTCSSLNAPSNAFVAITAGAAVEDQVPPPGLPLAALVPLTTSAFRLLKTPGSVFVTSDLVTCTPGGGSGSYTSFVWQEESSGSGNGILILSPNQAATKFVSGTTIRTGHSVQGRFVCMVTDSNGNSVISNTITVSLEVELDSGL